MKRRAVLGVILAAPLAARSQRTASPVRIGYLSQASAENDRGYVAAFRQGLKELGYVEGSTISLYERYASGRREALAALAAEMLRLPVALVVAFGVAAVRAVQALSSTIPIVLPNLTDPVAAGFAASLARPGGNVTGLSDFHPATVTKRLELLKELVPSAGRIAVLLNPANPSHPRQLEDLHAAALSLGLAIVPVELKTPDELDRVLAVIARERPDGLLLLGGVLISLHQKRIAGFALRSRLPAIYTVEAFAAAGDLIAYGANFPDMWRRAAGYVDRILKGAKPADLPIEQAAKFDLTINLKTARALGLKIPESVLVRVGRVIE
jgi:putative ABC transport system substrate-binding protein